MDHGEQGAAGSAQRKRKQDADQNNGLNDEKTWR